MSPRRNWDSPNPSPACESAPPPRTGGGGAHSPAAKGVGEFQFRRLEKKLSTLPTLWAELTSVGHTEYGERVPLPVGSHGLVLLHLLPPVTDDHQGNWRHCK